MVWKEFVIKLLVLHKLLQILTVRPDNITFKTIGTSTQIYAQECPELFLEQQGVTH